MYFCELCENSSNKDKGYSPEEIQQKFECCTTYCELKAGKNLVDFINGIRLISTRIGDLEIDYKTGKKSFIVIGHIAEKDANPTYILSGLDSNMNAVGKFIEFGKKSPIAIIKEYADTLKLSSKARTRTFSAFDLINSNKVMCSPLKIGTACTIEIEDRGKRVFVAANVKHIKWILNKKTRQIECTVLFTNNRQFVNGERSVYLPLTEYGKKIRVDDIEYGILASRVDRDIIDMTNIGFIRPIRILPDSNSGVEFIIDSSYVYKKDASGLNIIGKWSKDKIIAYSEMTAKRFEIFKKTEVYKYLQDNMIYLYKHKNYIAPYGFFRENTIDLEQILEKREHRLV